MVHPFPKEMHIFGSCISFEEECKPWPIHHFYIARGKKGTGTLFGFGIEGKHQTLGHLPLSTHYPNFEEL